MRQPHALLRQQHIEQGEELCGPGASWVVAVQEEGAVERICHMGRVPAVCKADRDQVIPCGPFCPGQAHPARFSQGLRAGQEPAALPMEPLGLGTAQGAVWVGSLPAQHGFSRSPGPESGLF